MRVYGFSGLERYGRLGNQLWQVAAVVSRSAGDLGSRPSIKADWEYRKYFSLPEDFYDPAEPLDQFIDMLRDPNGPFFQRSQDIGQADVWSLFAPSPLARRGLHQRYSHFLESKRHKTALHIRRGDYVGSLKFPTLPNHYYQQAVKTVLDEYPTTEILVFSDDIHWCRENADVIGLTDVRHAFIEGHVRPIPPRERIGEPADVYDLFLMVSCDAHIIANSTFSWWGAYLSEQDFVIYPSLWFGPSVLPFFGFPPSWHRVEC